MKLYEEIIFLQNHFDGKYVVENVIPYYKPLIDAKEKDRHLYWTNFNLPNTINSRHFNGMCQGTGELERLKEFHDYDFIKYKGEQQAIQIARNLVDYEAGKTIFETMLGIVKKEDINQTELF